MVEVIWEVDDGYCCGGRPQTVDIDDEELLELETEKERKEHIESIVNERFLSEINWDIKDYGLDALQEKAE